MPTARAELVTRIPSAATAIMGGPLSDQSSTRAEDWHRPICSTSLICRHVIITALRSSVGRWRIALRQRSFWCSPQMMTAQASERYCHFIHTGSLRVTGTRLPSLRSKQTPIPYGLEPSLSGDLPFYGSLSHRMRRGTTSQGGEARYKGSSHRKDPTPHGKPSPRLFRLT